jgi:hypothetical protein
MPFNTLKAQNCVSLVYDTIKAHESNLFHPWRWPIDTVAVYIHVIRDDNGNGNIPNTTAGRNWLQYQIDKTNTFIGNLDASNYPNATSVGDLRIRYKLENIFFFNNSTYYNTQGTVIPSDSFKAEFVNSGSYYNFTQNEKDNKIHVFLYGALETFGGYAVGNAIRHTGWYYRYLNCNTCPLPEISGNLTHEAGHIFGVRHNYKNHPDPNIRSIDTTGCDNILYGINFDHLVKPDVNNFMAKSDIPDGYSVTWCQRQIAKATLATTKKNLVTNTNCYKLTTANNLGIDPTITINEDITLNYPLTVYSDIHVWPYRTLTIKCTLRMAPQAKIIVEPGGKLVVDGGHITNHSGCNKLWGGIEVWGNANQNQFTGTQGRVEFKNGAVIENAHEAVAVWRPGYWSTGGGIVSATNTTFRNNWRSIMFASYRNKLPNGQPFRNFSTISNCTFEWNSNWYSTSHWPNVAVATWGTQGISFSGCTFKNNSPLYFSGFNSRYKGKGIYAEDAALTISGCNFEHLYTGIETGLISSLSGMRIHQNNFESCGFGVFNRTHDYFSIIQNNFDECVTNVFHEGCSGFENTQNSFQDGYEGVLVMNSGIQANEIYNNSFDNMSRGVRAHGNGGFWYNPTSNLGLLVKCNEFADQIVPQFDIYVSSGAINQFQGGCLPALDPNKLIAPAGNEFSHTCYNALDLGAYSGMRNWYAGSNKLVYSHHRDNGTGPFKPRCYTQQEISTNDCWVGENTTRAQRCPQRYFVQGGLSDFQNKVSALRAQYYDMKDAQNDAENRYYNYLLDGGNTAYLLNYIDPQSGYGSALVYQEVMSATPFASDTVLHACILRNPALDTAHLYGILISNSPLSPYIHDAAVSYSNLSTEQLTQLAGVQEGTSPRMDSIALMRHYRNEAELTFNEIFRNFILDTNCVAKADSIIAWLAPLNGRRHLGEVLVRAYWEKENYAAANDVITEIGQDTDFNHLSVILNKLNNVFQSNDSLPKILTDSVLLDSIANDTTRIGYALARNILTLLNGREYPMPYWEFEAPSGMIVEPEIDPTGEKETAVKKFANISVSPNPNDGKINISIGGSKSARAYRMALYDLQGRVIYERILDGQLSQQTLHLPGYVLGNVILKIYDTNNNEVYQNRLVIIR